MPNNLLNKSKLSLLTSGLLALTMVSIAPAQADNYSGTDYSRTVTKNDIGYVGVKAGILAIDNDQNASSIDKPKQFGGVVGYKLSENFGVEVDYSVTNDADVVSKYNGEGKYKVASYGMYVTYYYPFAKGFYAKSKLGAAGAEIDETYISTDNKKLKTSYDDVGIAGGLGIGYDLPYNLSVEGELNLLRSDFLDTNSLSVAMKYSF